jgi:hypothetical protein
MSDHKSDSSFINIYIYIHLSAPFSCRFSSPKSTKTAQIVGTDGKVSLRIELAETGNIRSSLFDTDDDAGDINNKGKMVIDVTKLETLERHMFIEKLIKHIEHDNLRLLQKIRNRIDK